MRGLTTAASLWIVAAIGMAAGAGYYSAALIATGIVLVGLGPFRWLEGAATFGRWRRAGRQLEIDLTREHSDRRAARGDRRTTRAPRAACSSRTSATAAASCVELDIPLGPAEERLVEDLAALEGVLAVRWTE